jgi:hypothetical protein
MKEGDYSNGVDNYPIIENDTNIDYGNNNNNGNTYCY